MSVNVSVSHFVRNNFDLIHSVIVWEIYYPIWCGFCFCFEIKNLFFVSISVKVFSFFLARALQTTLKQKSIRSAVFGKKMNPYESERETRLFALIYYNVLRAVQYLEITSLQNRMFDVQNVERHFQVDTYKKKTTMKLLCKDRRNWWLFIWRV